jgi:hypothetical protein
VISRSSVGFAVPPCLADFFGAALPAMTLRPYGFSVTALAGP